MPQHELAVITKALLKAINRCHRISALKSVEEFGRAFLVSWMKKLNRLTYSDLYNFTPESSG